MAPHRSSDAATRFILYARKSNDREDRQIRSLGDQTKLAHEEALRFGFRIIHEIKESKSAKRPGKRVEFQEMLRQIEEGEANGILCWHPDRLARNGVDGGWIMELLTSGKLKTLHFLTYNFENTPEGRLMLNMLFSQAQYQVDKLVTDVSRGMREMREEGGFPHYVPEGYKNVRLDDGRKAVLTDPERFPLLRRAVDLILAEVFPPAEVLRMLNGWGYQTRTTKERPGGSMRESGFYRILHNPFYAGRCRKGDAWYQGKHEPLMSEAEFKALQRIVGRKDVLTYRKHGFVYGGGLFTCGNCGCQITATLAKGRHKTGSWVYYHCTNRRGICDRRGTREETIETSVQELLQRLTIPEEMKPVLVEATTSYLAELHGTEKDVGKATERRLSEARAEREKLLPLLLKGVLTDRDYEAGKQALDAEIAELSSQMAEDTTRAQRDAQTIRNVVAFAAHALATYEKSSDLARRRVVQMLSQKRVLTPKNALLEPHPYLHGFLEVAPKIATFKPPIVRSWILKETFSREKVSFGRPNESRIQICCLDATRLDSLCHDVAHSLARAILAQGETFPELSEEGRL